MHKDLHKMHNEGQAIRHHFGAVYISKALAMKHSKAPCKTSKFMYLSYIEKRTARIRIPRIPPGLDIWFLLGCIFVEGTDTFPTEATRTAREDCYGFHLELIFQIRAEA